MRKESEILAAESEYTDRVWFERKNVFLSSEQREAVAKNLAKEGVLNAYEAIKKAYGEENLEVKNDFEWGMINGKLSALRWVLGEDWDFLDT